MGDAPWKSAPFLDHIMGIRRSESVSSRPSAAALKRSVLPAVLARPGPHVDARGANGGESEPDWITNQEGCRQELRVRPSRNETP